jgi:hypothetical protein
MRRSKEQNQHLHMTDVEKLVDAILDEIEAALVRRGRVELRGFGAFFVRTRSARPGRNPKNGAMVCRKGFTRCSRRGKKCPSTEWNRWQRFARCLPQGKRRAS